MRNWRSKRYLAPLMRPKKFRGIPVSLERNTEVFLSKGMSGQVSRGSAGEYQADELAGVAGLCWRVSGR